MKSTTLFALLLAALSMATADALESGAVTLVLNENARVDPVELKKVYDRYVDADFAVIGPELAKRAGENPVLQGSIGEEARKSPWKHSLAQTLAAAWAHHVDAAARRESRGTKFEPLLKILEDRSVGPGRLLALRAITSRLHFGTQFADPTLPPRTKTIERLRAIAFDERNDVWLRQTVVSVLFQQDDPNDYVELVIQLSSKESDPITASEAFRFATPIREPARLTAENREKYLTHAFRLLEAIDDGNSGGGYFLANHIGSFVGIKPVRDGQAAFAPDQRLARYQGEHGLTEAFFQETVDNAMRWWASHQPESPDETRPGG